MSFDYVTNRSWRKDLEINRDDLENEWMTQASKYMYYAEASADAIKDRDKAKGHLEAIEAEIDNWIFENWGTKFETKPSEQIRRNYVVSQEKYKKALALLIEANYKVNLLSKAVNAFDHRKKALEEVVRMNISGYHAEPKIKQPERREHVGLKKTAIIRKKRN